MRDTGNCNIPVPKLRNFMVVFGIEIISANNSS